MASELPDLSWQPLYRLGGIAAGVYVVLVLVPVWPFPHWSCSPPPPSPWQGSARGWP